jgi:ribonuclease D
MTIRLHRGDLPDLSHYRTSAVAIDTETMGLQPHRDRLCVVQLSPGDGSADVVQMPAGGHTAPNLANILSDPAILKVFHFARRSTAPRSHHGSPAPTPIGTVSRISSAISWASI